MDSKTFHASIDEMLTNFYRLENATPFIEEPSDVNNFTISLSEFYGPYYI